MALFAAAAAVASPIRGRRIDAGEGRRDRPRLAAPAGGRAGTPWALAEEAGVGELITRQGVLFAYPDRAAFEAEALSWQIRRENGTQWLELDEDECGKANRRSAGHINSQCWCRKTASAAIPALTSRLWSGTRLLRGHVAAGGRPASGSTTEGYVRC